MRILLLALLIYILYRFFRKMIQPPAEKTQTYDASGGHVDEMVQDPFCGTYVPVRQAVKRSIGGKDHFFCSEACADRFEKEEGRTEKSL
ncbi:conserved hypothetical protein [uncultured Desulfatiglans sp.]|uniref:TRASH domain-containing protein n=1 Tax=Uncultured Desulfatiglans sp. TaxID=1748965 RepID=A0A653AHI7_UNCDX|nr:conserved hypothetical protein [uncultured Desulfatiglans sp.]